MNRFIIIKRIYSSITLLTLLYGLPFGLIMSIISINTLERSIYTSIIGGLTGGLVFGLLMAITQKKFFNRYIDFPDSLLLADNKVFDTYIKNGALPKSYEEKIALSAYMDSVEKNFDSIDKKLYPNKHSKMLSFGFLILFFFITLASDRLRVLAVIYPIIMIIFVYGIYQRNKKLKKISFLRKLL
jgi:hypothetical protein